MCISCLAEALVSNMDEFHSAQSDLSERTIVSSTIKSEEKGSSGQSKKKRSKKGYGKRERQGNRWMLDYPQVCKRATVASRWFSVAVAPWRRETHNLRALLPRYMTFQDANDEYTSFRSFLCLRRYACPPATTEFTGRSWRFG